MKRSIAERLPLSQTYLSYALRSTISGHSILQRQITSVGNLKLKQSLMNSELQTSLKLQAYTSGRWLRRDKLERDARFIQFRFEALCDKVIELCPSATSVESYEKLEGGYSKAFIFTMDNARQIVAKLPTRVAGPSKLTTHSEVATIKYLLTHPIQSNTNIPIPNILDWNDNPSNAIGSEYIIMDHVPGVQLHRIWPKMSGPQQIACIKGISMNIKQMAELEFPAYGSLYFADSPLIDENSKLSLCPDFCIGPHCGTRYWDCNVEEIRYYFFKKPNRGPWPDVTSYCSGLIDSGFSRLPPTSADRKTLPSYQGSVVEHVQLLNSCCDVLNELVKDWRIISTSAPTLLHPDLHKRNIFVSEDDPTVVTGIIDWQSTSIEPAFYYADESPDFATPVGEESKQLNVEMANICSRAFDACMKGLVPKLAASRALDDNLLRVFRYCHRTWKDGATVFKHELIQLAQFWEKLELPGPCPYALPTPEEMSIYKNQFKFLEDARNLKQRVVEFLGTTSDGWVPNDVWNETREAHMAVFEHMLQEIRAAQDSTFSAEELVAMWPFDICMSKKNDDDK